MKKWEKIALCQGCRDNFYNGNNELGVRECWSLSDARIAWLRFVHRDERPRGDPPTFLHVVPERTLACHHRDAYFGMKARAPRKAYAVKARPAQ